MGFLPDENPSSSVLKKRYYDLARELHPDKGGDKGNFQALVNAYDCLCDSRKTEEVQPEEAEDDLQYYEDHLSYWHAYFQRDRSSSGDFEEFDDRFQSTFDDWHMSAKEKSEKRRQDIKNKVDSRDRKIYKKHAFDMPMISTSTDDNWRPCMFCGVNYGISKSDAYEWGLNWDEYMQHEENYTTCWACLNDHTSAMTYKMAIKKFGRKLDPKNADHFLLEFDSNRRGRIKPIFFDRLRVNKQTFHYQPKEKNGFHTKNLKEREYFWYPDLEHEAISRGWKPRGGSNDSEFPWRRKDLHQSVAKPVVTPSPKRKKKKKQNGVKSEDRTISKRKKRKKNTSNSTTQNEEYNAETDRTSARRVLFFDTDDNSQRDRSSIGSETEYGGDWRDMSAVDW